MAPWHRELRGRRCRSRLIHRARHGWTCWSSTISHRASARRPCRRAGSPSSSRITCAIPSCATHWTGPIPASIRRSTRDPSTSAGRTAISTSELSLHRHAGIGRFLGLTYPYSERYTAGGQGALNDGVYGSTYFDDGHWQGFEGVDLDAVIDLERQVPVSTIAVHFLQNVASWIFLPTRVSFYGSRDGEDFELLSAVDNTEAADRQGASSWR